MYNLLNFTNIKKKSFRPAGSSLAASLPVAATQLWLSLLAECQIQMIQNQSIGK